MKIVKYLFPLWIGLLICGELQAQVAFTANTTAGCSPLVVQFTDQTAGATAWAWDFGNGNMSNLQNPAATYVSPGNYNVTLTATTPLGSVSLTRSSYITVYQPPNANIQASARSGCAPLNVSFTDFSTPGGAPITSWIWDFGDGTTAQTQNPNKTYNSPGTYDVVLLITDANGCRANITLTDHIVVSATPTAAFTLNNTFACLPPLTVNFTNQSSGSNPPLTYAWNFGNGQTSALENPMITYSTNGIYNVTLTVTNSAGCSNTFTRNSAVAVGVIAADFSASPLTGCSPLAVSFIDNSNPTPTLWNWDFGDGGTSTVQNPVHTYTTPGTYTVSLNVVDGACNGSETKTSYVTVLDGVNAQFSATNNTSCTPPITVNFSDNSTGNPISWFWDLGDTTSTLQNPVHTYNTLGRFDITLIVTNANGCTDTLTLPNFVSTVGPYAGFSANPTMGCAPLAVNFMDQSIVDNAIVSHFWDFGDGNTSTLANPNHVYVDTGQYTVTHIIVDSEGCTDTLVIDNYIQVGELPVVNFMADVLDTCVNSDIQFTDLTLGAANRWLWNFGDMTSSTLANPIKQYTDTGYFDITLFVWHNGCLDTFFIEDYIHISGPISRLRLAQDCDNPYLVTVDDSSAFPHIWDWDFGNGSTSTVPGPHTILYGAPGSYSIELTVYDTISGCETTVTADVIIPVPVANFTWNQPTNCPNQPIVFTNNSQDAQAYYWDFGNGDSSSLREPNYVFPEEGMYLVTLIIFDAIGCTDTFTTTVTVDYSGLRTGFAYDPGGGCPPVTITFTDTTTTVTSITSWFWDFGDGATSTLQNPMHTYTVAGIYDVSLAITTSGGCIDTLVIPQAIYADDPIADFQLSLPACANSPVTFINNSLGGSLSYFWNLGNGDTSSAFEPITTYPSGGLYNVFLRVTDFNGCTDTQTVQISIDDVTAAFTADTTNADCPPLIVSFLDSSYTNVTAWLWDFGDGGTSTLANPQHVYASSGSFDVTLVVRSANGCFDTLFIPDFINVGPRGNFTFNPNRGCIPLEVTFVATAVNTLSYTWDFGDGTVLNTPLDSVTHTYTTIGVFYPSLILNGNGCTFTIPPPDSIVTGELEADFTIFPTSLCEAANVTFTSNVTSTHPITSYFWDFGDGSVDSFSSNPTHFYSVPGSYDITLIVTNSLGCTDTLIYPDSVQLFNPPVAIIAADTFNGCYPVTVNFFNFSTNAPNSPITNYLWNFDDGSIDSTRDVTHTFDTAGTFFVTMIASTINGCSDTDTVAVTIRSQPIAMVTPDTTICFGDSVNLLAVGGSSYRWYPSTGLSNAFIANPEASPTSTITYLVVVSQIGCVEVDSAFVTVTVRPKINVNAGPDKEILFGESVTLNGSSNINNPTFAWTPAAWLSCTDCAEPDASPPQTTEYILTVIDQFNCNEQDRVEVKVINNCRDDLIFIPNTFTPNNDGENDLLIVRGAGLKQINYFRIFNRWGELLHEAQNFQPNDESFAWDGTYKGQVMNPGVVVYVIEGVCGNDNPLIKKGNVTIMK